jgi:hypothetical protein
MRVRLAKVLRSIVLVCGSIGALLAFIAVSVAVGLPPYPYFTRGSPAGAAWGTATVVAIVAAVVAVAAVAVIVVLLERGARRAMPAPTALPRLEHEHGEQRKAA